MCASRLLRRSGIAVGNIAELLKWRPDNIIQVGVGMYHQEMDVLTSEWPGINIIGFEAHPEIFKAVEASYPGVLHNFAVSRDVSDVYLYSKQNHKDGSSLFRPAGCPNIDEIVVQTITLDHFFYITMEVKRAQIPATIDILDADIEEKENLLWLDCEGSELAALEGAERLIEQIDIVNVEMTANPPGDGWCSPVDVHDWLRAHDFWLQWTHSNRSSAGQCDVIYVRPKLFNPRYCSCPFTLKEWGNRL